MSQFPPLAPWLATIHFHPPTKETVCKRARLKRYPGHFAGIQGKIVTTLAPKRKRVSLKELRESECKWRAQQTTIGILHNKCHEWRSKCERLDESSQAALETKIEANMSAGTASPIKTQKQIFIVGTKKHRMKVQQGNAALNEALSKVVGTLVCCGSIRKKILKKQVKV